MSDPSRLTNYSYMHNKILVIFSTLSFYAILIFLYLSFSVWLSLEFTINKLKPVLTKILDVFSYLPIKVGNILSLWIMVRKIVFICTRSIAQISKKLLIFGALSSIFSNWFLKSCWGMKIKSRSFFLISAASKNAEKRNEIKLVLQQRLRKD